jgi:hypothetical protein
VNANEINSYLQRAQEIIGDRTEGEKRYDDAIIRYLAKGMTIKKALEAANRDYPDEALQPGRDHWEDLHARYTYILEHKAILRRLGIKE